MAIAPYLVKRYHKIRDNWINFKRLRSTPYDCNPGHPDFLSSLRREQMIEDLLAIIELSLPKKNV